MHFIKSSKSKDSQLFMNDGSIIPYVDTCNHLGNTVSIKSDKIILDNAVNDLYMRTNCLLSSFLFSECSALSHLFKIGCGSWHIFFCFKVEKFKVCGYYA